MISLFHDFRISLRVRRPAPWMREGSSPHGRDGFPARGVLAPRARPLGARAQRGDTIKDADYRRKSGSGVRLRPHDHEFRLCGLHLKAWLHRHDDPCGYWGRAGAHAPYATDCDLEATSAVAMLAPQPELQIIDQRIGGRTVALGKGARMKLDVGAARAPDNDPLVIGEVEKPREPDVVQLHKQNIARTFVLDQTARNR